MLLISYPKFFRKKFLPRLPLHDQKKQHIERWLRGREEFIKLRRSDAVIVSYEKSGRTWLRVMLTRYYQRRYQLPDELLLDYDNLHKLRAEIPSVLFTHDRYLRFYHDLYDADRSFFHNKPVILLVRDPRDVAVSMYFHWQHRIKPRNTGLYNMPQQGSDISISDFVFHTDYGLPSIIRYMNQWLQQSQAMPRLCLYRYEDLRANTEQHLEKLLCSLGEQPDKSDIAEVVAYAEFEKMKQREQAGQPGNTRLAAADASNPDSFKARRAKVGGYRDYFDEQTIERIDRLVNETLDPAFGY